MTIGKKSTIGVACVCALLLTGYYCWLIFSCDSNRMDPESRDPSLVAVIPQRVDDAAATEAIETIPYSGAQSILGSGVRFLFYSSDGAAAHIGVMILKESGRRYADGVSRYSNAGGVLNVDLPPGRYRWRIASPDHVIVNPPHEEQLTRVPITEPNGSVGWFETGSAAPAGVSGIITVKAGNVRQVKVYVYRGAHVVGSLPTATVDSEIVLHRIQKFLHPAGPDGDLHEHTPIARLRRSVPGEFSFRNVPPGEYMVRCWWRSRDYHYYFRQLRFQLKSGCEEHIGLLSPSQPGVATLRLRAISQGQSIPSSRLAAGNEPSSIVGSLLLMSLSRHFANREDDLSIPFKLPIGPAAVLHGLLPSAEWKVRLFAPSEIDVPSLGRLACLSDSVTLTLNEEKTIDYVKRPPAKRHGVFELELICDRAPRVYVCLEGSGGSQVVSVKGVQPQAWKDGRMVLRRSIPRGNYRLLVHTQRISRHSSPGAGGGFFGLANVKVTEAGGHERLVLKRGVEASGVVERPDGSLLRNHYVWFRPVGWKEWVISTKTDEQGRFTLGGLPPDLEIEGLFVNRRFNTAAPSHGLSLVYRGLGDR